MNNLTKTSPIQTTTSPNGIPMVQINNNNISNSTTTSFEHEFITINNNNTNLLEQNTFYKLTLRVREIVETNNV